MRHFTNLQNVHSKMKEASLISLIVLFLSASQAVGDIWCWPPDYTWIVPGHPNSTDIVAVTQGGEWSDTCTPNGSAISVDGNDIYFDAMYNYPPDIMCFMMITPWNLTEYIGPLPEGAYTVYARLVGHPDVPEVYEQVKEFIVTDKQFVLSADSVTVPEGQTVEFTVRLLADPEETIEVTISHDSGDNDITIESGAVMFFDPCNYSIPQSVTLTAAEDDDLVNGTAFFLVSAADYVTALITATEADNEDRSVIYVDFNAPGANIGTSWQDALMDLQEALSIAQQYPEVEEIHVAHGTYTPTEPNGDRYISFRLAEDVSLKGGYAGCSETYPDARNFSMYKTILSGDLNGDDGPEFTFRADNSRTVVKGHNGALLEGFIITGGESGTGAGINTDGKSPSIINCTITDNRGPHGGGLRNDKGNPILINCMFIGNEAKPASNGHGGGIYSSDSGGNSSLALINCTFAGNSANYKGGGVFSSSTDIVITDCIFWGNSDANGTVESSQIDCENLVVNYSCVQGWTGVLGGAGNIGNNPLFADSDNGDYHLKSQAGRWELNSQSWILDDTTSPCVDAGNPGSPVDFEPFPNGGIVNMGAYGGTTEASKSFFNTVPCEIIAAGDINGDCEVNLKDFAIMAFHWLESHNP